jgi:hypothetical protein
MVSRIGTDVPHRFYRNNKDALFQTMRCMVKEEDNEKKRKEK